ncbi:MAG TPA: phosphatase PAP2 family protein [Vicinamibacteria bacterium]|nr:phosphatase PAP2 family protein [Vicinamibacteria bacterium]
MNAMLSYVSESDIRVSGRLRGWNPPRWFRVWMIWATRLGDGWLWLTTGLVLTFGGSQYHRILAAVAVSAGITNILVVLLKRRFRRMRPGEYLPNRFLETCLNADHFAFDRFSFPSGHSMNASAVATVLTLAFPPLGPLWAALAASIAVSRIVLGQHFVSDVCVGSAVGAMVGAASFYLLVG